ncbi:MAG: hypothetical protein JW889_04680 [Verrucomicrobia bacterium]|nr:hypothetical protein [Verrucomicrobiota bacterium]
MRRLAWRVIVAGFVVLGAVSAAAVEVFVKAPTKLYDSEGKVIQEVSAGYPFQADKAHGKWVYGFLPARSGGVRGWIPADALDLNDETKRLLGVDATPKTGEQTTQPDRSALPASAPVLLRYRLGTNQTQAYDQVNNVTISLTKTEEGLSDSIDMMRMGARLGWTHQGRGRDEEGLILATVQIHRIGLSISQRNLGAGGWTEQRFDHEGMKVYDGDGNLLRSVRYGEGELADAPGVDRLLDTPHEVRFTDRFELRDGTFSIDDEEYVVESMGGLDLKNVLSGGFVYPEDPIKPGDSWEAQATHELRQPLDASMPAKVSGRARYTFEGRTTCHNRPAVKIRITGRFDPAQSKDGLRIGGAMEGSALIDEATGIRVHTTVKTVITMSGFPHEDNVTATVTTTTTNTYKGSTYR